jgi:hypothetical protein
VVLLLLVLLAVRVTLLWKALGEECFGKIGATIQYPLPRQPRLLALWIQASNKQEFVVLDLFLA